MRVSVQWIKCFLFTSEVRFPIVVTLYLLYRIETKLDTMMTSIQTLSEKL
ncbi:YvrJ family protein [Bacillus seohaeanensis]|uniref:YvrJ family protein n=1 Tax=Bacillus seohaeanensis TaxID=284580 RepID=A0ABW5RTC6_9BACI